MFCCSSRIRHRQTPHRNERRNNILTPISITIQNTNYAYSYIYKYRMSVTLSSSLCLKLAISILRIKQKTLSFNQRFLPSATAKIAFLFQCNALENIISSKNVGNLEMRLEETVIRQVFKGKQLFAILLTQHFNLSHRKSTTGKSISLRTK